MISFFFPCMKWKLLSAVKSHHGYAGFAGQRFTRYLSAAVVWNLDVYGPGADTPYGNYVGSTTATYNTTIARPDGNEIPPRSNTVMVTFNGQSGPMPAYDLILEPYADPDTLSDSGYTVLFPTVIASAGTILGNNIYTAYPTSLQVTLSNPYTLEELEADVDALLAAISPDAIPWMDYTTNYPPSVDFLGFNNPPAPLPAEATYSGLGTQPVLQAAAWSVYLPTANQNFTLAALGKLMSWIAVAGDYCRRDFEVDLNANPVTPPTCVSGVGSCAAIFQVTAPPGVAIGVNKYTLIIPDCQCGAPTLP